MARRERVGAVVRHIANPWWRGMLAGAFLAGAVLAASLDWFTAEPGEGLLIFQRMGSMWPLLEALGAYPAFGGALIILGTWRVTGRADYRPLWWFFGFGLGQLLVVAGAALTPDI